MDDLEVVRAAIDTFNRHDAVAGAPLFHPKGHEIVPLRAAVESTVFSGPDAFERFVAASDEMWESITMEVGEMRAVRPGCVLLLGTLDATSRETRLAATMSCGWVVELRDGLITSLRTYTDPAEAVRAAEE